MPPPPAEPFAPRLLLGPALRTQSDRRLVKLVREGYEAAFEEIVRRYRKPLDRFAAAFVGGRSEDVTQDAFSKALLALRGSEQEIELRPWLYRIVRNTALNDLRDQPDQAAELGEEIGGGESAAVVAERREEIRDLMSRLRALPEPQRAAIVMRELEGLSHEEIAAALGLSGGGARQAIYRARTALRDGLGLLLPLPLLRMLIDHGAEAAGAGAGGALAAAGAATAGGGGAAAGGLGAAGALKVGVATALLAGSVGAGVAMQHERGGERGPAAAEAAVLPGGGNGGGASGASGSSGEGSGSSGSLDTSDSRERGEDSRGERERGDDRRGEDRGRGRGGEDDDGNHRGRGRGDRDDADDAPSGIDEDGHSGSSGHGRGGGRGDSREDSAESHSGSGHSGSGSSGSGSSGSGSGRHSSGSGSGGSGSGSSGSGHGSGGSGGSDDSDDGHGGKGSSGGSGDGGSDDANPPPVVTSPPPPETPSAESDGDSGGGGSDDHSGSGGSGGSGGDDDDS